MEKITKKEFIELLCSNTTALVVRKSSKALTGPEIAHIGGLTSANAAEKYELQPQWRTVVRKQTNAVKFSNESLLYFNQVGEKRYYRVGDTLLQVLTDGEYTLTLGYLIKR